MLKALKVILEVQELDMQLIQLMRLKKERLRELENLNGIKANLRKQLALKEAEIYELKKNHRHVEGEVSDIVAKIQEIGRPAERHQKSGRIQCLNA